MTLGSVIDPSMQSSAATVPSDADVADLSAIFAALSDPTRLRIIYSIIQCELSVGAIAAQLDLSEASVSQHLRRLRLLRVVRRRQVGRRRLYQLDDEHVATLLAVCIEHVRDRQSGLPSHGSFVS